MAETEIVAAQVDPGPKQEKATNKWQWIAVVGIGTFLLPGIVGWMVMEMKASRIFYQTKMSTSVDKQTEVMEKLATAMDNAADSNVKVAETVEKSAQDRTLTDIRIIEELDDFSDAAKTQSTQIDRVLNVLIRPNALPAEYARPADPIP